jgi:hypothetical protein
VAVADGAVERLAKIATYALPERASAEALSQGRRPQQSIILRPALPILTRGTDCHLRL